MLTKVRAFQRSVLRYPQFFIAKSDKIPSSKVVLVKSKADKFEKQDIDTNEYFKSKRIVLVGYPGAFTPVCTSRHLPEYIQRATEVKGKKVDEILSLAINDPWVIQAFAEKLGGGEKMGFIADGNGEFTKALNLTEDLSAKNLSTRSKRFAAIVEDGKVKEVFVEEGKETSFVSNVLKYL